MVNHRDSSVVTRCRISEVVACHWQTETWQGVQRFTSPSPHRNIGWRQDTRMTVLATYRLLHSSTLESWYELFLLKVFDSPTIVNVELRRARSLLIKRWGVLILVYSRVAFYVLFLCSLLPVVSAQLVVCRSIVRNHGASSEVTTQRFV